MEDPNQLVEYRDLACGELGRPYDQVTGAMGPISADSHDAVFDHLPASGRLSTGLLYRPWSRFDIEVAAHNVLNERASHPDVYDALAPQIERLAMANVDYWLTVTAQYRY